MTTSTPLGSAVSTSRSSIAGLSSTALMRPAGGASASEPAATPTADVEHEPPGGSTSRSTADDAVSIGPRPSTAKSAGTKAHGGSGARARISAGIAQPASCAAHRATVVSPATTARSCPPMEMHFATVWESIADATARRPAVVHGEHEPHAGGSTTSAPPAWPARCVAAGLGPDSKVGLYLYNSNEYLEAQFGAFKIRGVPINVNYRYLDDELAYLLDNADAEALVFHTSLGDRVARVAGPAPEAAAAGRGRRRPAGDGAFDGAVPYEELIAAHEPMAAHRARRGRHLHALHRRHDRHAQGRDVRHGRADRRVRRGRLPAARHGPARATPPRSPRWSRAVGPGRA